MVYRSLVTAGPRKLGVCVALCGSQAWIGAAQAGVEVESVHVVYDADPGCPGRPTFVDELMARTPKVAMAAATRAKRTFVVTVRATESGFLGRLEIQAGASTATTREIAGLSCPAVVSAVALVAALAVDPESLRGDAPGKDGVARDETQPPSPTAAHPTAVPPSLASSQSPEPRKNRDLEWAIGARAEGNALIAPQLAFGGGAFVELAPSDADTEGPALRGSFGIEAVRVAAHYALTGTVRQTEGAARFDWGALSLEGCPFHIHWRKVGIGACAAFEVGFLHGRGEELSDAPTPLQPETPLLPWYSVAPLLRVKWAFLHSWFLDAEGSLMVPLRRDTFVFQQPPAQPRLVFYEVPRVGAGAGIGIGYRFDDRERDRRP
jgi:hypothetical protein